MSDSTPALKVTALSVDDAALLLAKCADRRITGDMLRQHLAAGAPQNADGTINLVHFAAWLVRKVADRDD